MTPTLSPLEARILRLARDGRTTAEQARALGLTHDQVAYRRRRLLRRLGAANIVQALAIALEAGLLGAPPRPLEPIGPRQRSAFHAKAAELDRALDQRRRTAHDAALAAAAEHLGRPIASVNDLSYEEASWALDWLDVKLVDASVPA